MSTWRVGGVVVRDVDGHDEGAATDAPVVVATATTGAPRVDAAGWPAVARLPDGAIALRFADHAIFVVAADLTAVTVHAASDLPPSTREHLLLDHVLPRILQRRGRLVLHASVVAVDGRAVAFSAPSGTGKSTLALALVDAGARLMADDALVLEARGDALLAHPLYPGVRLWRADAAELVPDAATTPVAHYFDKVRVAGDRVPFADAPAPLARVYFLAPGDVDDVRVEAPHARDALVEVLRNSFRLDPDDRAERARELDALASSPVLRLCRALRYPKTRAALVDVVGAVHADVRGG